MKVEILSLALALGAVVFAIPAVQSPPDLVPRDTLQGTTDCRYCTGTLNFCFKNGHTRGQDGCKQTCREHICHRMPECKKCRGEFDRCPKKSRYHI